MLQRHVGVRVTLGLYEDENPHLNCVTTLVTTALLGRKLAHQALAHSKFGGKGTSSTSRR